MRHFLTRIFTVGENWKAFQKVDTMVHYNKKNLDQKTAGEISASTSLNSDRCIYPNIVIEGDTKKGWMKRPRKTCQMYFLFIR